ncbi:hypothetical protein EVAR_48805_1 [Eumeta japonica]|uniref:Uncharacterized protein n=1 Tax=Eumeta variegata TaxID=151549 RepID=A0A4C1Y0P6_EUMVA|nr:hypothetical protein EVAR_48805_1 [Eumeta japonica]
MAAQVEHVIHQSRAARSMLRPVLRSHLPLRTKIALYKGYICSRLTIALRKIVGAGRYVLNNAIARDLCTETVEEFIQRIAYRMYVIADQGPYEFLRNIALTHERSPSGRPLPRELVKMSEAQMACENYTSTIGSPRREPLPPEPSGLYPRREHARA